MKNNDDIGTAMACLILIVFSVLFGLMLAADANRHNLQDERISESLRHRP